MHSQYYASVLAPEFSSLVDNLDEMSRRWRGLHSECASAVDSELGELDLAGRFTLQLVDYHSEYINEGRQILQVLRHSAAEAILRSSEHVRKKSVVGAALDSGKSPPTGQGMVGSKTTPRPSEGPTNLEMEVIPMHHSPEDRGQVPSPSLTTGTPASGVVKPYQAGPTVGTGFTPTAVLNASGTPSDAQDNLMAMSDALMAQGFANLDRVIMSDGADFSFNPFDFADFSFGPFDSLAPG